jgi:hypothetical protein
MNGYFNEPPVLYVDVMIENAVLRVELLCVGVLTRGDYRGAQAGVS